MNLQALATIGSVILENEFSDEYPFGAFTTPWTLDDKDLDLVLRVKFDVHTTGSNKVFPENVESLSFTGTEWRDVDDVISAAERHMYAHRDQHIDYSLSRRVTSNSYSKRFNALTEWVGDAIDDGSDCPVITSLGTELSPVPEDLQETLAEADDSADEKALLAPVFVEPDGTERYLGELDSACKITRANVIDAFENASAAKGAAGAGECACCGASEEVYGMGANSIGAGRVLPFKQQGPFPQYAAANSWRSRPLCADCIQTIGIGLNGFVDSQSFNIPQIRCRIIPYGVAGNTGNVEDFVRRFRDALPEPGDYQDEDAEDAAKSDAFLNALDRYTARIEGGHGEDDLRLFVLFYKQNKAKIKGIHSLEGISYLSIESFLDTYTETYRTSPLKESDTLQKKLYDPDDDEQDHQEWFTPTRKQLLSGYWFFRLFFNNRNRKGNGESTPDPGAWRTMFENIIVDGRIDYEEVIREGVQEITEERGEDYNWGYYLPSFLRLHHFIEACDAEGYLTGLRTNYPKMKGINETYDDYGSAVAALLDQNPGLRDDPGRATAFTLGVLASRLSAWQSQRNVNKSFIGTHSITQLDSSTADEWVTQIWDKALTYNQQENNGGVPWQGVFNVFHDVYTDYEHGAHPITTEEFRYYYIAGVNTGSAINTADYDNDDSTDELEEQTN